MARKAETLWEVKQERRQENAISGLYLTVRWYALRADGKLLEKFQTKELDGKARYDYGWKLSAARIHPGEALDKLKALGFTIVSETPGAKPPVRRQRVRRGY